MGLNSKGIGVAEKAHLVEFRSGSIRLYLHFYAVFFQLCPLGHWQTGFSVGPEFL